MIRYGFGEAVADRQNHKMNAKNIKMRKEWFYYGN